MQFSSCQNSKSQKGIRDWPCSAINNFNTKEFNRKSKKETCKNTIAVKCWCCMSPIKFTLLNTFYIMPASKIRNSKKLPIAQRINFKVLGLTFILRYNLELIFHCMLISHIFSKWSPISNPSHLIHIAQNMSCWCPCHCNKILSHINLFETLIYNLSVTSSSLMRPDITIIIKISFLFYQSLLVFMICTIYSAVNDTGECMNAFPGCSDSKEFACNVG